VAHIQSEPLYVRSKIFMTLDVFTKMIDGINERDAKIHELYKLGVDLINLDEEYHRDVTQPLFLEAFGEKGWDWISWFIYERPSFRKDRDHHATDENGNPICYDIPSLFEYIKNLKHE
jgi:hypothetical protein